MDSKKSMKELSTIIQKFIQKEVNYTEQSVNLGTKICYRIINNLISDRESIIFLYLKLLIRDNGIQIFFQIKKPLFQCVKQPNKMGYNPLTSKTVNFYLKQIKEE